MNVTIQDPEWNSIWTFGAEDNKSFSNMAKNNDVEIMTSCGAGACGICKCKIIEGHEYIQVDKISKPLSDLPTDDKWKIDTIFTCVAWVKSEYLKDDKNHKIVLRRNI